MFRMVDVCGGKMSLREIYQEIFFYMYHKSPKRLIVDIYLVEGGENPGYRATFWISKRDFQKKWQKPLPKDSAEWLKFVSGERGPVREE